VIENTGVGKKLGGIGVGPSSSTLPELLCRNGIKPR